MPKFLLQTWNVGFATREVWLIKFHTIYQLPLLILIKIDMVYLNVFKKLNDPKRHQPTNYFTA